MYLFDNNLLIALFTPEHIHHRLARKWRVSAKTKAWASCEITESGFVRLSANPRVVSNPRRPADSYALLKNNIAQSEHRLLTYTPSPTYQETLRRCQGHNQVPDAYLIAMAIDHGVVFATFDQKLKHLSPDPDAVEVIPLI